MTAAKSFLGEDFGEGPGWGTVIMAVGIGYWIWNGVDSRDFKNRKALLGAPIFGVGCVIFLSDYFWSDWIGVVSKW